MDVLRWGGAANSGAITPPSDAAPRNFLHSTIHKSRRIQSTKARRKLVVQPSRARPLLDGSPVRRGVGGSENSQITLIQLQHITAAVQAMIVADDARSAVLAAAREEDESHEARLAAHMARL